MQPQTPPAGQTAPKPIVDIAPPRAPIAQTSTASQPAPAPAPIAAVAQPPNLSVRPVSVRRAPDEPEAVTSAEPDNLPVETSSAATEPPAESAKPQQPAASKPSRPQTNAPWGLIYTTIIVMLGLSAAAIAVYLNS